MKGTKQTWQLWVAIALFLLFVLNLVIKCDTDRQIREARELCWDLYFQQEISRAHRAIEEEAAR